MFFKKKKEEAPQTRFQRLRSRVKSVKSNAEKRVARRLFKDIGPVKQFKIGAKVGYRSGQDLGRAIMAVEKRAPGLAKKYPKTYNRALAAMYKTDVEARLTNNLVREQVKMSKQRRAARRAQQQ